MKVLTAGPGGMPRNAATVARERRESNGLDLRARTRVNQGLRLRAGALQDTRRKAAPMVNVVIVLVTLSLVPLAGCASSKQARSVEPSGFLGDYSLLQEGREGEALLLYIKPHVAWKEYARIQLDPVQIWRGPRSKADGIPSEDLQRMADHFYNLIYFALSEDYEMVDAPGPGTLRVQVALTKLEESWVAPDIISTIVPKARLASKLTDFATGKPAFVGEAAVEAKVTDARTGELLYASVGRRVGGKNLDASALRSWGDVEHIMEFWAAQGRYRLCELREGVDCVRPEE